RARAPTRTPVAESGDTDVGHEGRVGEERRGQAVGLLAEHRSTGNVIDVAARSAVDVTVEGAVEGDIVGDSVVVLQQVAHQHHARPVLEEDVLGQGVDAVGRGAGGGDGGGGAALGGHAPAPFDQASVVVRDERVQIEQAVTLTVDVVHRAPERAVLDLIDVAVAAHAHGQ